MGTKKAQPQTIAKVTISTSGTPVPLSGTELLMHELVLQAPSTNASPIKITSQSGDAADCLELAAGAEMALGPFKDLEDYEGAIDLNQWYVDGDNGDVVKLFGILVGE